MTEQVLPVRATLLEQWSSFHSSQTPELLSSDNAVPVPGLTPPSPYPTHLCMSKPQMTVSLLPNKHQVIPTSSLAAQVRSRGQTPAKFAQQAVPRIGHEELLVRLSHSGVCATDYATYAGTIGDSDGVTGFVSPHVGGHEGIGIIVAVGRADKSQELLPEGDAARKDAEEFEVGQRVGIRWISKTCEKCTYCLLDRGDLCAFQRITSVHEHGTFQQICRVHTNCAVRIPESVDAKDAAAMMCAGSTAHTAVKQLAALIPRKTGTVAILGAGGSIGHMAIEFARIFGYDVIAVDRGLKKQDLCLRQGASHFFDAASMSSESVIASILKLSTAEGHAGVEGVIVAAGGSIEPFNMGLEILRPLGVLMLLGNPSPETHLSVDIPKALVKNIKIVSTLMSGMKDCAEALDYLAMGQIHPKLMIRSFMDLDQVLKDIKAGLTLGKVILPIG